MADLEDLTEDLMEDLEDLMKDLEEDLMEDRTLESLTGLDCMEDPETAG